MKSIYSIANKIELEKHSILYKNRKTCFFCIHPFWDLYFSEYSVDKGFRKMEALVEGVEDIVKGGTQGKGNLGAMYYILANINIENLLYQLKEKDILTIIALPERYKTKDRFVKKLEEMGITKADNFVYFNTQADGGATSSPTQHELAIKLNGIDHFFVFGGNYGLCIHTILKFLKKIKKGEMIASATTFRYTDAASLDLPGLAQKEGQLKKIWKEIKKSKNVQEIDSEIMAKLYDMLVKIHKENYDLPPYPRVNEREFSKWFLALPDK